jgi:hypothetical protein
MLVLSSMQLPRRNAMCQHLHTKHVDLGTAPVSFRGDEWETETEREIITVSLHQGWYIECTDCGETLDCEGPEGL